MSSAPAILKEARQSPPSLFLIVAAGASLYYCTYIYFNYQPEGLELAFPTVFGVLGLLFLLAGCYTLYKDWEHELEYRKLLRRDKEAEVELRETEASEARQRQLSEEEQDAATVLDEDEELPVEDLER